MKNSSIYDKIVQKGTNDANEIMRLGQEKAKALEESIINNAQKEIDKLVAKSNERNKDRIRTMTTEFEQSAKQKSLSKKKEIIDQVFDLVHNQLLELSDEDLTRLIVKMILSDDVRGDEVIQVAQKDYQKFIKLFSSGKMMNGFYILDKISSYTNNNKYQFKLSKDHIDIDGGFIIIGEAYDIDHSFETMLENMKEEMESDIAKVLFDSGE